MNAHDDDRDTELGKALFDALGRTVVSRNTDFSSIYAEAARRRKAHSFIAVGIPCAAVLAFAILVPSMFRVRSFGPASDSYRSLISDLSSRTIVDASWEDAVFSAKVDAEETPLGEFLDDLWNL